MGKEQDTAGAGAAAAWEAGAGATAASPIKEGNGGGAGAAPPPGGPGGGPEKTGGWTGFDAKMAGLKIFGGGARNGGPVDDEAWGTAEYVRPSCLDLFGDLKNCSGELC